MSINIKELYKSDLDPTTPSVWWSSKKIEKLNWNFDQIKLSDGGPYGPQGFEGLIGDEGVTGNQGASGTSGFQGRQGVYGVLGFNDWTKNTKVGANNITIKYDETKSDPANYRIGFANSDVEYGENDDTDTVKRYNTKDAAQNNLIFIASNIGAGETNIPARPHVFFNLHTGNAGEAILESGFQNVTDGVWKFRLSPTTGAKYSFLTPKSSPTELLEITALNFTPKVVSEFDADSTINGTVKISTNTYGVAGVDKIAATDYDQSGQLGTVMWKDTNQVLPTFPIGSIIAVDKEFTSTYFSLNKTGTITNISDVGGYVDLFSNTVEPTFKFDFGAGLDNKKFKGWYLCNGKTWYKGSVSYTLPNLCGFDLHVDYPVYGDSSLMPPVTEIGLLEITTTNRQLLGTAQVGFDAEQIGQPGYYVYTNGTAGQTKTKESYIDLGEPLVTVYGGTTTSNQLKTSTGKGDGLFYLCFLGEGGFTWDTAATAPTVNTISLSWSTLGYGTACGNSAGSYDCNFVVSTWSDTGDWSTNTNKLYITGSSTYASTGWYARNGVARYWSNITGKFSLRFACPNYTSTQLVYNSAAINSGINGAFSGLSKSTYYIDGSSLSNSNSIFTNSSGTSQASAGWYRDSGCRRYWSGVNFQGGIFTLDYVNVINTLVPLGYGTTGSAACSETNTIYGYYQNSVATSLSFSTISNLYVGDSSAGSGVINYADATYYYSDTSIYRKCNNSATGALNSAVSCSTSPTPSPTPGGGGSGGGCVLFGTKISMPDGTFKQVQDLSVGESLLSKAVVGMPMKENQELFKWNSSEIKLVDDNVRVASIRSYNVNVVLSFNDGKLFTSKDHLHVYKSNGIWQVRTAINIKVGDFLLGQDGKEIEVNSIVETKGNYIVYKLDVEENDLFIANGILTHNLKQEEQQLNQL